MEDPTFFGNRKKSGGSDFFFDKKMEDPTLKKWRIRLFSGLTKWRIRLFFDTKMEDPTFFGTRKKKVEDLNRVKSRIFTIFEPEKVDAPTIRFAHFASPTLALIELASKSQVAC